MHGNYLEYQTEKDLEFMVISYDISKMSLL